MDSRITKLLGTRYPIIQGGMIWVAGWRLAAAVSNAGGLGTLGAGSLAPDLLREHILKLRAVCDAPFAVNVPLTSPWADAQVDHCIAQKVPVVITSAGSPKRFTARLAKENITALHVVPSAALARKVQDAGCDGVIAEGTEAGGHNGVDEITSMVLWPSVVQTVKIPVVAAGGIVDGAGIAAAFSLGADGVQLGTRFALTTEASAHPAYKQAAIRATQRDIPLFLRGLAPTRSIRNGYVRAMEHLAASGASSDEMAQLRSTGRSKMGIFDGDLDEGDLEIGQAASLVGSIESVEDVMVALIDGYAKAIARLPR